MCTLHRSLWEQYLLSLVAMLLCERQLVWNTVGIAEITTIPSEEITIIPLPPKTQLPALYTAWNYLPLLGRAASGNKISALDFSHSSSGKPVILDLFTEKK